MMRSTFLAVPLALAACSSSGASGEKILNPPRDMYQAWEKIEPTRMGRLDEIGTWEFVIEEAIDLIAKRRCRIRTAFAEITNFVFTKARVRTRDHANALMLKNSERQ